jgi:hypothetical protein
MQLQNYLMFPNRNVKDLIKFYAFRKAFAKSGRLL